MSDPEDLALAAASSRILVSHDRGTMVRHFGEFCRNHRSPGLIIVRQRASNSLVLESIILIWGASEAEEWSNAATYAPL